MPSSKRTRRKRIWERAILRGEPAEEIVPQLADEFDVDEEVIEADLVSVTDWLSDLEILRDEGGIALLVELRANRQQLHQLADYAREDEEFVQERKIRQEINRSINFERQLHEARLKTKPSSTGLETLLDDSF